MHFRIHRIVENKAHWQRPSAGRLGKDGYGEYVKEHGFGHEDWNFDLSLEIKGELWGYTAAKPRIREFDDRTNLMLATWSNGRWYAVGCYLNARFVKSEPVPPYIVERKMSDYQALPLSSRNPSTDFRHELETEAHAIRVAIENIKIFPDRIEIPHQMAPNGWRMRTSYKMAPEDFEAVLGESVTAADVRPDENPGHAEGRMLLRAHKRRERSGELIKRFKDSLSNFSCVCCGFNFESVYGEIGKDYIEAHHLVAVSGMKPGYRTKLEDLVAVCANCHRMIHKTNPMLTTDELTVRLAETHT